jgi:hypothetical protein
MVKARMRIESNIVTFFCPGCNGEDVAYINMPRSCYRCGFKYDFLITRLVEFLCERKYHHFKVKTKNNLQ